MWMCQGDYVYDDNAEFYICDIQVPGSCTFTLNNFCTWDSLGTFLVNGTFTEGIDGTH